MPKRGSRGALAAAVGILAVLAGCSSPSPSLRSLTPPIPTGSGSPSERSALLATDDLRAIPSAPAGLAVDSPQQQGGVFEQPNPKGPCGGPIALPDFATGANDVLGTTNLAGSQLVDDVSVARATTIMTEWQDDTRPGCPSYASETNTGATETTDLLASIPLPAVDDQECASVSSITSQGHSVYFYALLFRQGGRLEFDVLLTPVALPSAFERGFAQAAGSKLKASLQGS